MWVILSKYMEKNRGVHLIHKNLGETPHEAILRFKKENPEYDILPVTYAGRLDPMAEGLLVLLSGDRVMEKNNFLDLPKEYEFEILWGPQTDTLDILGLALEGDGEVPSEEDIKKYLKKSLGKFEQLYPAYSSRPVNGKSLFEWAREGRISEVDIPKHTVEVFESEFLGRDKIKGKDLLNNILEKIDLVDGDFRQQEIKESWKNVLALKEKESYVVDKIKLKVSSGFYVRQFVFDLAKNFGQTALTASIIRTKIGDFSIRKNK
jgi:tRNA pseudouridine55 synthase